MRMCNKPLDDGGFCNRVGDHDDACDALPILDQLCEQDERFRKAAVAHVRDLLATARAEGRREGLELLSEAAELLHLARSALIKLGVYSGGNDLRLAHEARMFALRFSPRTTPEPKPEHSLTWTGTGECDRLLDRIRALLTQSPPKEPSE